MRQIAYHVAASWINANAAVQLARDIRISPKLGDCRHGSGCPLFAMSDALTSLNPQASVPTGRSQCSRRDFCFARLTMRQSSLELWSRRGSWRATIRPPLSQRAITQGPVSPMLGRAGERCRAAPHAFAPARSQACEKRSCCRPDAPIFEAGAPDHKSGMMLSVPAIVGPWINI